MSQVERGDGSFTAEQFIEILKLFNASVSDFVPRRERDEDAELQNALARAGASHLRESPSVLVSHAPGDLTALIRASLVSGSPRLIAALGPVIVENADKLRFDKVRAALVDASLERRFFWLLENVQHALRELRELRRARDLRLNARAAILIDTFLADVIRGRTATDLSRDILDADIRSEKSRRDVAERASDISKRWGIVTALQPRDFREAIEEARAATR